MEEQNEMKETQLLEIQNSVNAQESVTKHYFPSVPDLSISNSSFLNQDSNWHYSDPGRVESEINGIESQNDEAESEPNILMIFKQRQSKAKVFFVVLVEGNDHDPNSQVLTADEIRKEMRKLLRQFQFSKRKLSLPNLQKDDLLSLSAGKDSKKNKLELQQEREFLDNIVIHIDNITSSNEQFASGTVEVDEQVAEKILQKHFNHPVVNEQTQKIIKRYHVNFQDYEKKISRKDIFDNGKYQKNFITLSLQKPNETNPTIVGMGRNNQVSVMRSFQIKDQQIYAVKRIELPHVPSIETYRQDKIFNQVRAMTKFNHKNIVRLYSWWVEREEKNPQKCYLYMKMEYLSYNATSNSLLDYLYYHVELKNMEIRRRRIQAFHIFSDVLLALDHMHSKGYCHLDLKPENILVTHNNSNQLVVKVTDFDDTLSIESENVLQNDVGTLGYVIKKAGDTFETRDDLHGLGHVLLDCVDFNNENRLRQHQALQRKVFPEGFEEKFPEEKLVIDLLSIRKTVRTISTLTNCITFKKWKSKIEDLQKEIDQELSTTE